MEQSYVNLAQPPEDNLGGLQATWYTPASNLLNFPSRGPLTIQQLQLRPGTFWYQLVSVRGSVKLTDTPKAVGRHGDARVHKLIGALARHTPGLAAGLETMEGGRFVALVRDLNGAVQLVGSPDCPLQWQDTFDSGSETQRNGYDWTLQGEGLRRCRPYLGSWEVANGGLLSVGTEGSVIVRTSAGEYVGTYPAGSVIVLPAVGDDASFNWNRPVTAAIPGLQGKTVGGSTVSEGLENMFFEPLPPGATLQLTPAEYDYRQQDEKGGLVEPFTLTVAWSALRNGAALTQILLNGVQQSLATGGASTNATVSWRVTSNAPQTITLVVRDANGKQDTASATARPRLRRHGLTTNLNLTALLQAGQLATVQSLFEEAQGEFADGRQQVRSLSPASQFVAFRWPQAWGMPSFKVNGLANNDWSVTPYLHTTATGYQVPSYLVQSGSRLSGPYTIEVL